MRPYGMKPMQFRGEDCGPTTKYADLKSKHRVKERRRMHKHGRRLAREAIRFSIITSIWRG